MDAPPWLLFVTCVVMVTMSRSSGMHVTMTYRDVEGRSLEAVDMDPLSNTLILGAENSLTKLSQGLSPLQSTLIKGYNSSSYTHSRGVVIDSKSNTVISCTSAYSSCNIHLFSDINNLELRATDRQLVPKGDDSTSNLLLVSSSPHQVHFVNSFKKHGHRSVSAIPVISSRVPQTLDLVNEDKDGSSEIFALDKLPEGYSVQYVYSFTKDIFIYFISRQPNAFDNGKTYSTKISRKCLKDGHFRSFVEIQLDCLASAQIQYPHARAAYFEKRTSELFVGFTAADADVSAVCKFSLTNIDRSMDEVIRDCYDGEGALGPPHFHKKASCFATSAKVELCGETAAVSGANPSIEGRVPVWQSPIVELPNTRVTAITTAREANTTVVYLGTSKGALKKMTIQPSGLVSVVREINLDLGQPIYRSMFLDSQGEFLYAMTKNKLMKVSVDHCTERTSCQACTSHLDSVCGWCVMKNRCSRKDSCPAGGISPRWLPSRNGVCVQMTDVTPSMLSYKLMDENSNGEISFRLDKLKVVDASQVNLHCSFKVTDTKETTLAVVTGGNRIVCPLPPRTRLPTLPQGVVRAIGDHNIMEVEFQAQGRTIVKREWLLNDCRVNTNCTSCTESTVGCKWCHVLGMCVDTSEPACPNQTVSAISSASLCPRLEILAGDTDILIHSGQTKSITVRVANMQQDQRDNVHCVFTFQGQVMYAPGKVVSANLYCDPLKFAFNDTQMPIVTAEFTVTSGVKSVPLDNPQHIKVRIYKCGPMVTNCGQCLGMDPNYECGWCKAPSNGEPVCSLETECPANNWLDRVETCPNPQILRFNPQAGPIQGKSNISVTGLNLGSTFSDLEVTVAGQPCIVHAQNYESSQRFECEVTGPAQVTDGVITVIVKRQYTAVSDSAFMFVEPQVTSLSPKSGPISGGTTLTITGNFMNAGSKTTVDIGGSPCAFVRASTTELECVTSAQTSNDAEVEVNFGGLRKLLPEQYMYDKDPLIKKIEPTKTILSGGTSITAIGNQMQLIQNPKLVVKADGGKTITTKCKLQKPTNWLVCKTPRLGFPGENITETNPREVHYGFSLDGVMTYKNISTDPSFSPLLYYPDPEVEMFPPPGEDGKKYEKDNRMVIKGNFSRIRPVLEDVSVTVGGAACAKLQSSEDAITCQAPKEGVTVDDKGNAIVMLNIGNMKTNVGYMSYADDEEEEKPLAIGIILGVVLPIIVIGILLAICVIRRHRKHKPSENYIPDVWKDTQEQHGNDDIALNHVSVKADMNGSIPDDKETAPYIEELLNKIDDDAIRHNVSQFLISRKRLDIGDLLGKGNFGVTYKATYSRTDEDSATEVVVNTLQGNQTDIDSVSAFLQTITVYKDLQHAGVAPIVGVCVTHADDPMIVAPYAQSGDLKSYVRDSNRNLTALELLDFGQQVAEAMAYLQSVHIVHGNLALRNCLITDQKTVQVTDYGLTKELFSKETYFKEDDKLKTIVKWAAPETIEPVEFTSKSDVWSYGVLLWELLTRGVTPYPDVDNSDLKEYLEEGSRMKKPQQCPEQIYELMLRCWNQDAEARPSFREIADEIHTFTTTAADEQSSDDTTPLQKNVDIDEDV